MFLTSDEILIESDIMDDVLFESVNHVTMDEHSVRLFPIQDHRYYGVLESELLAVCEYYDNYDLSEMCELIAESHNISENDIAVLTEGDSLKEKKEEILRKLKTARSYKERKKFLTRLKNLNKIRFFKQS